MKKSISLIFVFIIVLSCLSGCGRFNAAKKPEKPDECTHEFVVYADNHDYSCYCNGTLTAKCQNCSAVNVKENKNSQTKHVWKKTWNWNSDLNSAVLMLSCENCDAKSLLFDAPVSKKVTKEATCSREGECKYTAAVTFLGEKFTDEKIKVLPKLDCEWSEPIWSIDRNSLTASVTFVCKNNSNHINTTHNIPGTPVQFDRLCVMDMEEDINQYYTFEVSFDEVTYTKTINTNEDAYAIHNLQKETMFEATCSEAGLVCNKCVDCDYIESSTTVPVKPHDYEAEWNWNENYTTVSCSLMCKEDESHSVIVSVPHISRIENRRADCSGATTTYIATIEYEGKEYTDKQTVNTPLSHEMSEYYGLGTHTRQCHYCGYTETADCSDDDGDNLCDVCHHVVKAGTFDELNISNPNAVEINPQKEAPETYKGLKIITIILLILTSAAICTLGGIEIVRKRREDKR